MRLVLSNLSHSTAKFKLKEIIKDIEVTEDAHTLIIELLNNKTKTQLLQELIEHKIDIESFANYEPSLYDIFVSEVGEEHA